jgi:hypothetical protein
MFKQLNAKLDRLPRWAKNGTKENLIAQLSAAAIFVGFMIARDEIRASRERRNRLLNKD